MSTSDRTSIPEKDAAPRTIPHRWVLAAIFVTYVITRYPDVGGRINMGDSAKFQFLARLLGVGHAPGNPLYLMASALWVRIPLPLSDATKVTLLSGVAGVVAIALASRAVGVLALPPVLRRPFVLEAQSFAAILLGTGSLFWTLSTEAEVYTLGSIFVAGVLLGMTRWIAHHEPRALYFAIGSLGLGLGNHLTIAALGPAVLYVLLREREGRAALRSVRLWAVAAGALGLAALSYGWIAWRVKSGPLAYSELPAPFAWPAFLRFVTARGVMSATSTAPSLVAAMTERLPDLFAQLQKQWCWPLLLFVPFGFFRLYAKPGFEPGPPERREAPPSSGALVRNARGYRGQSPRSQTAVGAFVAMGVLGHFAIAFFFRVPDPEGLFVSVSVLLVVPLACAAASERTCTIMLVLHGALAVAHVAAWYRHPFSAYIQQTPEGKVILNLPTLHEVVPEHAMVGVPCGHYGCVEITSYYALLDPELRAKDVSFVRFSWSEWDDSKTPVPLVDPRQKRTRPICVLLSNDVAKLRELGFAPAEIPRPPVRVLGHRFVSPPLYCLAP